jgi:hypothetical protein
MKTSHSLEFLSRVILKFYHEQQQCCCLGVARGYGGDVVEKEN